MSYHNGGVLRGGGRGGGGGGRGGGGGDRGGRGPGNAHQPPTQQFSGLSLNSSQTRAVDGSPLQMDYPIAEPRSNPTPSNTVDTKFFQKILKGRQLSELQAPFPLRSAFSTPNTTVYTNSFAMKLDTTMPLYEYKITGLPESVGRRTAKVLVQEAINSAQFFQDAQGKFATDYKKTLISWVELPKLNAIEVRSAEGRDPVSIHIDYVKMIDIALLQQYAEGKLAPTKACP
jgi:eukaryotic translation initiation factor 2C